jgi:hypothetical protein
MNQIIWKEFRENLKWAVLGLLIVTFLISYQTLDSDFFFESSGSLYYFALVSMGLSFGLGLLQIFHESAYDRWAFLRHRPSSARQIVCGKTIAGLSILLLIWTSELIFQMNLLRSMQTLGYPLYWYRLWPVSIAICVGIPAYFSGLMLSVWRPRVGWVRWLTLGVYLVLFGSMIEGMQAATWNYLWIPLAIILFISALMFEITCEIYRCSGEQKLLRTPALSFQKFSVVLTITFVILMAITYVVEMTKSPILSVYKQWFIANDGSIYVTQHHYDYEKQKQVIDQAIRLDTQQNDPELVQRLANQPGFNRQFSSKLFSTENSDRNNTSQIGVFKNWPMIKFNLHDIRYQYYFSKDDGYIYRYTYQTETGRRLLTHVIGKEGLRLISESRPASLGQLLYVDQTNVPYGEGDSQGSMTTSPIFLIICREAIYKYNSITSEISEVYKAPSDQSILHVAHQESTARPLFLVELTNQIDVLHAQFDPQNTTEGDKDENGEYKKLFIYPTDKITTIFKHQSSGNVSLLSNKATLSTSYLSEKKTLLFMQRSLNHLQLREFDFSGKQVSERIIQGQEFALGNMTQRAPFQDEISYLLAPVLFYLISIIVFTFGPDDPLSIQNIIHNHLATVIIYLVILTGSTTYAWWSCRKAMMTRQQTRSCLILTVLMGLPGLIAFWLIESPEPVTECKHCHARTPARLHVCTSCQTPMTPADDHTGKEILSEELNLNRDTLPLEVEAEMA